MSSFKRSARDEQVAEIVKCGKDPIHFIKNYVKIQHPMHGAIPFDTYPFQDSCIKDFRKHRLNIVLKSRQLGLSTVCAAYATWMAIFHKDKNILVIATKLATAINFIKKVHVVLQNIPSWLLMPKFEPSKQVVSFSNGSQIKAIPTSPDAGRSEALSLLVVDEAAFIADFDEIWAGLAPTISTGGQVIVLSTPNGVGGQYYTLWVDAEAGVNGFNPIRLPWDVHPEHDVEWFAKETRNLSRKKLSQEYMCSFVASGDTFLQPEVLDKLRLRIVPPIEKAGEKYDVWIWEYPIPGKTYVISADVARGDSRDFSTFHVIDEDCVVVAEYMGKTPPERLATLLSEWGDRYNKAMLIPENNTFGYFVNSKLKADGYKNLYYRNCRSADPRNYVPAEQELPGFLTDTKTRVQILTKLEELLRNDQLVIKSQRFFDQIQAFVWNGNKPMASKDSHDDLIMSLAIGSWIVGGGAGQSASGLDYTIAMLNATCVSRRDAAELPMAVSLTGAQQARIMSSMQRSAPGARPAAAFNPLDYAWLIR